MSGVKVRTIPVQQDRLRELERRSRLVQDAQARQRSADRARDAELRRRKKLEATLNRERNRQERLEQTLDGLNGRVLTLGRETDRRIAAQRAELMSELSRVDADATELRTELRRRLAEVNDAARRSEQRLDGRIDSVVGRLDAREDAEEASAEAWLEAVAARITFLDQEYRHERFAPGELAALREGLELARESHARGLGQAAVGSLQGLWTDARRLQDRLEAVEGEWDRLHAIATEAIEMLEADAASRESVQLELDGQPPFDLRTDHWTHGGLEQLRAAAREFGDRLEACDLEGLNDTIDWAAAGGDRLDRLEAHARASVLASVERADLQGALLDRLGQLGYRLRWNRWADDDFRSANHMALCSPSDEEIVIVVSPSEEADGVGSKVEVNFRDRSPNETVRRMRLKAVEEVLSERLGAAPGGFEAEPGFEVGNAPDVRFDERRLAAKGPPGSEGSER